jgi:translation initiation factor IF-3
MSRKKSKARKRGQVKTAPNVKVKVIIPKKPYRFKGDIYPGWIVAEGKVKVC